MSESRPRVVVLGGGFGGVGAARELKKADVDVVLAHRNRPAGKRGPLRTLAPMTYHLLKRL